MKNSKNNLIWQPFVPYAGANAQAVFNPATGAAVNLFILAGAQINHQIKNAQIFMTYPGYNSSAYLYSHTIVNELSYDEKNGTWCNEILFDPEKKNYIKAEFITQEDKTLRIEMTAHNNSEYTAEWVVTVLTGLNSSEGKFCEDSKRVILPDEKIFSCMGNPELYSAPQLTGNEYLSGIFAEWGRAEEMKKYSGGFLIQFMDWTLRSNSTETRIISAGIEPHAGIKNTILRQAPATDIQTCSILEKSIMHLNTQLSVNRRYPASVKHEGRPFPAFTPCPSMDIEYLWDAGFTGLGLTVFNPALAETCISQYLPLQKQTIWPNVTGAAVPIQIEAAWELYQQTRQVAVLQRLYPGLHELWLCATGLKDWPGNINLDSDEDCLILAPSGGSGLDDAPSQAWTRGYGVKWARQEHYWARPVAVNPTGKCINTESVNMTAFVILGAKILKQMRHILGMPAEPTYDKFIDTAECSLATHCWNEKTGHFHWVVENSHEQVPYYDISGLSPLFSNSAGAHKETLVAKLFNIYMTPHGLTTVDLNADFFRRGYWGGTIWVPFNWLFWKWFIGQGMFKEAHTIANRILEAYAACYAKCPACYENIDPEPLRGAGDLGFSGLAAPLLNLWSGYYKKGTLSIGFETIPLSLEIELDFTMAKMTFISAGRTNKIAGLIVLLSSRTYLFECNNCRTKVQSDKNGVLEFCFITKDKYVEIKIQVI